MSWYLCTIGRTTPGNWELCKQVSLYGLPGHRRPRVQVGDHLLIWQGGKGYIAEAVATGSLRRPSSQAEAPWPGGTYRFTYVIPIKVVLEVKSPLKLPFDGNEQYGTGFAKGKFQLSMSPISDKAAMYVSTALGEKRLNEVLEDRATGTAHAPSSGQYLIPTVNCQAHAVCIHMAWPRWPLFGRPATLNVAA